MPCPWLAVGKGRISLTSGTEWLKDADAALVVTERAAMALGAARRDSALGTRRALDNMADVRMPLSIEGGRIVVGITTICLMGAQKNRGVER
jgi:hypothetical protein